MNIGLFRTCPSCNGNNTGYVQYIKTKSEKVQYLCEACNKRFEINFEEARYIDGEEKEAPFWYWITYDGIYTTKCCICRTYIEAEFPCDKYEAIELPTIDPDVGWVTCCRTSEDLEVFSEETGLNVDFCAECESEYIVDGDYLNYVDYEGNNLETIVQTIEDWDNISDEIIDRFESDVEYFELADNIPVIKDDNGYSVCFSCGIDKLYGKVRLIFDTDNRSINIVIDEGDGKLYNLDKSAFLAKDDLDRDRYYLSKIF